LYYWKKSDRASSYGGRQYFLDWVRVLAFAFLIFYHTGMMFVSWGFHIESGHNSLFLKSIMVLTGSWRLDILFMVSGVAISYMCLKTPLGHFAWQRVLRLYIPLLFAIAVVVAPQSYYEALQKGIFEGTFWQFWSTKYFSFTWDTGMEAPFPTYNHMWYVLYLFHYTILLLPLIAFINSAPGERLLKKLETWLSEGTKILFLPFAVYFAIAYAFGNTQITHAFYNDWYAHCIYLVSMVMGLLFVRMPAIWLAFERNRRLALAIGLVSYALLLAPWYTPIEELSVYAKYLAPSLELVVKWSWIALVLGYARHYLNYTNAGLRYCNKVVYPVFILHQSVIIVLGYYVIDWGLSGVAEYFIIALGTFGICIGLYEGVLKHFSITRILFGMKWKLPKAGAESLWPEVAGDPVNHR